jgi:hypothetical protein
MNPGWFILLLGPGRGQRPQGSVGGEDAVVAVTVDAGWRKSLTRLGTERTHCALGYTGMDQRMEESDTEEIATHRGPESWVDAREGIGEALTGARTGEVSSREIIPPGCRRGSGLGRQHGQVRYASAGTIPRGPRPSEWIPLIFSGPRGLGFCRVSSSWTLPWPTSNPKHRYRSGREGSQLVICGWRTPGTATCLRGWRGLELCGFDQIYGEVGVEVFLIIA